MKIGIIGANGWLGSALGKRLIESGTILPAGLTVFDRVGQSPDYFGYRDVVWAQNLTDLVDRSDVVVLSVRPEDWKSIELYAHDRLVISFMASMGLSSLTRCGGRIVRAMPNAAAEFGRSYTSWFAADDVTETDRQWMQAILASIGTSDELAEESQIDVLTALSGSGSAYPALMASAMLNWARLAGLAEPIARRAVEATVCGGAQMLAGRIEGAEGMVSTYRDYRGVTAAGLDAAEDAGFVKAINAALDTAVSASQSKAILLAKE